MAPRTRQHSLRNSLTKEPSVLTHDGNGAFGVSARQILEMNEDGLPEDNMVSEYWSTRGAYVNQPGGIVINFNIAD